MRSPGFLTTIGLFSCVSLAQNAPPPHWSFVPPHEHSLPATGGRWVDEPIDAFVLDALIRAEGTPNDDAERRTLLRRITFDLTGLPPTPDDVERFLADRSPAALERVIDRLLASPRYGEHMARSWLDLVRFADTNGIHHDHYREMTPYRDWVVRAFNENLAFDTFLRDQLAGDLYENPTTDELVASGYNRLHLVIDKGTALPEESFHRNVVDRVDAFGTVFLGLSLQCATCHEHKVDPITQKDYYQLYAFFNNVDTAPETPGRNPHAPLIRVPTPHQEFELEVLERALARASDETERTALAGRIDALRKSAPIALITKERDEVRPAHVMIRGAYDRQGAPVERNTPAFLPKLEAQGTPTRLDLARWATSPANPLTARVAVNRIWQQVFGVGLVKTSEDFGRQGQAPSHPTLLDDLTTWFVASGWDVKGLVRAIVRSHTYRQSSVADAATYRADPANRQLARGSRFRLDAEAIRDQMLAVSGLLNDEMFGRSVKPPQPPGLWKSVSMRSSSTYAFQADDGDRILRRSLYSFWKRALPPPQMTIFDAPSRESCIARRERTNTPLQALVLMNEAQCIRFARHTAFRTLRGRATDDEARIRELYERITTRLPDAQELAWLREGLDRFRARFTRDETAARDLTQELTDQLAAAGIDPAELAAHTMLVNVLFNLDVAKTRE
ncbi:MAG: DUF1553 domain-containing protein [Planctomycetes bacterium]|nr:DUF1553 domain-containing protein [Planctomycetota bacterium]